MEVIKDNTITWEADVECPSCNGTGLYKGFAERDASAVICSQCKGTGMKHIKYEYKLFNKRKLMNHIERVYKSSGGYLISNEDKTTEDGKIIKFSQYGCSYDAWLRDKKPTPIRDLHCPLLHFSQGTEIGEWLKNNHCYEYLNIGGSIYDCSKGHREECWKFFDSSIYSGEI